MQTVSCTTCGEKPIVARNSEAQAVEISCLCGAFRWAPSDEMGNIGERPIEELEAEAVGLWNTAQGATVSALGIDRVIK